MMIHEEREIMTWTVRLVRRSRSEYPVSRVWANIDRHNQRAGGEFLRHPFRPVYLPANAAVYAGRPLRIGWGLLGDGYIGAAP